ncbi:MAG TPA: RsmE family RNA methyltransferase [Tepidisphaeraceae bacterium]
MARRLLVPKLVAGEMVLLPAEQAHHARDVLRLEVGDEVELFTASGETAAAVLSEVTPCRVVARVEQIRKKPRVIELTIASAIPKGARADWMIEKLSELGVARFVPLATERSVVHPEGRNKIERWERLATESAKQSRRTGVMRIDPLTRLEELLEQIEGPAAYLSTAGGALPLSSILHPPSSSLTLLVGPEGGWTDGELGLMSERHLTGMTLGATILRVETAAIAAAAVVAVLTAPGVVVLR